MGKGPSLGPGLHASPLLHLSHGSSLRNGGISSRKCADTRETAALGAALRCDAACKPKRVGLQDPTSREPAPFLRNPGASRGVDSGRLCSGEAGLPGIPKICAPCRAGPGPRVTCAAAALRLSRGCARTHVEPPVLEREEEAPGAQAGPPGQQQPGAVPRAKLEADGGPVRPGGAGQRQVALRAQKRGGHGLGVRTGKGDGSLGGGDGGGR